MKSENSFDLSVSMAAGLGIAIGEATDSSVFQNVRRELNRFLLNLNHGYRADCPGQKVHFLFLALEHLDRVEKEICVFGQDQDAARLEKIRQKTGNLKFLIINYIRLVKTGT